MPPANHDCWKAVALVREECVNDTMYTVDKFPTPDPTTAVSGSKFEYYYIPYSGEYGGKVRHSTITIPADQ
jgi:hypothetical protein